MCNNELRQCCHDVPVYAEEIRWQSITKNERLDSLFAKGDFPYYRLYFLHPVTTSSSPHLAHSLAERYDAIVLPFSILSDIHFLSRKRWNDAATTSSVSSWWQKEALWLCRCCCSRRHNVMRFDMRLKHFTVFHLILSTHRNYLSFTLGKMHTVNRPHLIYFNNERNRNYCRSSFATLDLFWIPLLLRSFFTLGRLLSSHHAKCNMLIL